VAVRSNPTGLVLYRFVLSDVTLGASHFTTLLHATAFIAPFLSKAAALVQASVDSQVLFASTRLKDAAVFDQACKCYVVDGAVARRLFGSQAMRCMCCCFRIAACRVRASRALYPIWLFPPLISIDDLISKSLALSVMLQLRCLLRTRYILWLWCRIRVRTHCDFVPETLSVGLTSVSISPLQANSDHPCCATCASFSIPGARLWRLHSVGRFCVKRYLCQCC